MAEERKRTVTVNEGIRVKEAKTCLLCGNEGVPLYQDLRDRLFGAPGMWSLMQCPKCELVWLNPQPVTSDIDKFYVDYYTHQPEDSSKKSLASLRKAVKARILQNQFGYPVNAQGGLLSQILSWIGPLKEIVGGSIKYLKASDRGCLLDVGCGNGRFLAQMRELGWEVMGVEPDSEAVCIAKERFGLDVFQGTLEEAKFPDNSFDAITMNHVIEHVPDPIGLLVECRRVLKPSSKLVMVTPNIQSLGRRLFGEYWRGWEVPRHLFLFSPKSLRACAKRAGLKVQSLWTPAKRARSIWIASRMVRKRGKLRGGSPQRPSLWLKWESLAFWAVEYLLCQARNLGEEIVLEAVK